jgi:4-hydroxy-tetrahydrodipicolinate synthase
MITGSLVAIVTPMKSGGEQDGALDLPAFRKLIDWHVAEGTDDIVVVGTTGESPTVNVDEHKELIRIAVQHSHGRIPIIAGTGGNSTAEAIELTEAARKNGATASLSVVPYYNKPTQEGMYRHFRKIAETVDLPMILYNVPARTVADLQNDTVLRLAQVPGIIGIKDATANIERGTDLVKRLPRNFAIYSGEDSTALALIVLGGHGVISVTANVAPKLMRQMCAAALVGDVKRARDINLRLLALHQRLFVEANPIPVKWALAEMGLIEHGLRLPLSPLSEKFHQAVREALHEAGIALPGLRVVEGRA